MVSARGPSALGQAIDRSVGGGPHDEWEVADLPRTDGSSPSDAVDYVDHSAELYELPTKVCPSNYKAVRSPIS